MTEASIRWAYFWKQLERLFPHGCSEILEIGGGYGGLCGVLYRAGFVKRSLLVDLPENLALEFYYLSMLFPRDVSIAIRTEDIGTMRKSGITLVAPWLLSELTRGHVRLDLLINIMSFQHMTAQNLAHYFTAVDRIGVRFLYLVNRDYKRDPGDVEVSNYPIPPSYTLRAKGPWLFGDHVELLYERVGGPGPD